MRNFEDLELYKACRKFRQDISNVVRTFPKDEKHRLVDQLLRCSRSITANIAEGHGRYHFQENIQSADRQEAHFQNHLNIYYALLMNKL